MHRADERPVLQFLICSAEILQSLPVQKLNLSHRTHRRDESGNVVDDLPPREFARTQSLFHPLPIFDVYIGSVPPEDLSGFVSQWISPKEEPAIYAVETSHARFSFNRHTRSQSRLPIFHKPVNVVGMNRSSPTPALCLFL